MVAIKNKKIIKGFTLVEVLVALFLLFIAISAATGVASRALSSTQTSKSKFIASYLVQEGIELIRNIRDENWSKNQTWDEGLSFGDWEADYNSALSSYSGKQFKVDSSGLYNYTNGTVTNFKRKISINKLSDTQIRVISRVDWSEKGKSYNISAVEDLYNWYEAPEIPNPPSPPPPPPPPENCFSNGAACGFGSDCCSGYCYTDVDKDGYAPASGLMTCQASDITSSDIDCDDNNASIYPGTYGSATCTYCDATGIIKYTPAGQIGKNCTAPHYRCDGSGNCTAPQTCGDYNACFFGCDDMCNPVSCGYSCGDSCYDERGQGWPGWYSACGFWSVHCCYYVY